MNQKTQKLVRAALIAALYVALCLALAPLAFGPVQVRVSEALTLLVVLCPEAVAGVTVGCFAANLLATVLLGATPVDIVVGPLVTLAAALVSRRLRARRFRGLPLAASLPPVLFNAVIVGAELTLLYTPGAPAALYLLNMASVGAGQIVSCCVLGCALVWVVEKNKPLHRLLGGASHG